ncbi:hypothetical protein [Sodalis sp.]
MASGLLLASGTAQIKTKIYYLNPNHTSLLFSWNHPTANFGNLTITIR